MISKGYSKKKKGQAGLDLITLLVIIFVVGAVSVVSVMISANINTEIQADDDFNEESKGVMTTVNTGMPLWFDNMFMFIMIFFWLGMIISSFMIDSHPVFFIVAVVLIIISMFIGAAVMNSMEELMEDDDLSSAASLFPKLAWIIDHWVMLTLIMGFSAAIAMYAKAR